MENNISDNKTDYLKRLYKAHDIIADIGENIQRLYASATIASPKIDGMPKSQHNPTRFENIMVQILELEEKAENLLTERVAFDLFMCTLLPFHKLLLDLRCRDYLTWKEIAAKLNISPDTAERTYRRICDKAKKAGII